MTGRGDKKGLGIERGGEEASCRERKREERLFEIKKKKSWYNEKQSTSPLHY